MTRIRGLLATIILLTTAVTASHAQEAEEAATPYVRMSTNLGDLYIELWPAEAPVTVENFLTYVRDGFYDGTIFHRVIPGFVIQGGGFTAEFSRKPTREPIVNEADNGLKNARGTLSMARTNAVNSGTSQFFVNLVDNLALDHTGTTSSRAWGYAVFARVVRGMDVVDQIAAGPTGPAGPFRRDVPTETVIIEKAEIVDALPPMPAETTDEATDQAEGADGAPADGEATSEG